MLLLTGCSTEPVILTFDERTSEQATPSEPVSDCLVMINEISDIRKDKESLGALGLREVKSDDLMDWLKNVLIQRNYRFKNSDSNKTNLKELNIALKLAYIRSAETTKATKLVLAVNDPGLDNVEYFRGTDNGINWTGSQDEIKSSFSRALTDSIKKMETGLNISCTE